MSFSRRAFVQSGSLCMTQLALTKRGWSRASTDTKPIGRVVLPINQRWRFSRTFEPGMVERTYDDSALQLVTLPHTNVELPWHGFDQQSSEFVSLYRRHLHLPGGLRGRRAFIRFEGVMTASSVWFNDEFLGSYAGGYTPFSFELTKHFYAEGTNVLAVKVDSNELPKVPPFGYEVDFLPFGGIYREVSLIIVPKLYIEKIIAKASGVMDGKASLETMVYLSSTPGTSASYGIEVTLFDGSGVIASVKQQPLLKEMGVVDNVTLLIIKDIDGVSCWELENPRLYTVRVRFFEEEIILDEDSRRVGFRTAKFTEQGFQLNGRMVKLRGLNRHQTYPYVGGAMPARVQRRDAQILKSVLKCNVVRTSHYPPSRHFLDACDELGLLVIEEIPGWQHVGDDAWQVLAIDNVRLMIERDQSRPAIILWSVRINESRDFHDFYVKTNALAHQLDPTRQTIGVRYFQDSELLEDVFGMNDFKFPLKDPNHSLYLNTEFVGAEWPTRSSDNNAIQREHVLRYARIYNQLGSDQRYAGGLGWCAFDYNTHADFGSGDHVCYMGVMDIFREPKAAAGFYRSQCDPSEEAVLEPAFHFAENDESGDFNEEVISSNCDLLRCSIQSLNAPPGTPFHAVIDLTPDRKQFPYLAHPPFFLSLPNGNDDWGTLRIDGYVKGHKIVSKTLSGSGAVQKLEVLADDEELFGDGSDSTRVVMRVTDEFCNVQRLCGDPLTIQLWGPGDLLGSNIVALSGGTIAVWIKTKQQAGIIRMTVTHETLGKQAIQIRVTGPVLEML
jgi:beta-galactosidase